MKKNIPLPDLLLVDGAMNQINVAKRIYPETTILGIAKGEGRKPENDKIILSSGKIIHLKNTPDSFSHLLQRLRDKARKSAISQHRKKRDKAPDLLQIKGIGVKIKDKIVQSYRNDSILNDSPEQIAQKANIDLKLAQSVFKFLHPDTPPKVK